MRVFVVLAVLAVLSGCQARSLLPEADVADQIRDFFTDLRSKVEETVENIKSSPISTELENLGQAIVSDLQTRVGPVARDDGSRLSQELQEAVARVRDSMRGNQEQAERYVQESQATMEHISECIRERLSAFDRKQRKRLNRDMQVLNSQLAEQVDQIQTRATDMVENIKATLAQVQETTQPRINTLADLLRQQAESIKEAVESKVQELRTQFEALST